ncbi:uncharacterized protein METZ01_LOCUS499815, partial [marine metagenome]
MMEVSVSAEKPDKLAQAAPCMPHFGIITKVSTTITTAPTTSGTPMPF